MKKLLLTATSLLLIITVQAQTKGANIIGFSTGYYNAVENPNNWWWWDNFDDEVLNFSRGVVTKVSLQRDIRISKRTYFSPSTAFILNVINTSTEGINGDWRTFTQERDFAGAGDIRFKRYIGVTDDSRYYISVEAGLAISLFENTNRNIVDASGERNTNNRGTIFQRNTAFFPTQQSSWGINLGYEKQLNKNQFWYLQAGYSRLNRYNSFTWDNYLRRVYSVGVGIGFQKFKSR